jgi:bacterioferritin-associated ferredoxin
MKHGVTRKKILAYMRKNPNSKPKELSKAVGVGISCVYNVTNQLRKELKATQRVVEAKLNTLPHEAEVKRVKGLLNTITQGAVRRRIQGWNPDDNPNYLVRQVDVVNHPAHYKVGGIEVIDFIESKGLTYNLGNVVKYVSRADHKGNKLEDLKKAQWYLNREVSTLEKSQ